LPRQELWLVVVQVVVARHTLLSSDHLAVAVQRACQEDLTTARQSDLEVVEVELVT
jgi:hypothetical protein